MHLVDKASAKVLLDCRDSTAEPNMLPISRFLSSFQCGSDAVRDEMKFRTTCHNPLKAATTLILGTLGRNGGARRLTSKPPAHHYGWQTRWS